MRLFPYFLSIALVPILLFGGYSRVSGKWSPDTFTPTQSMQEHYDQGSQEFAENHWDEALIHFMVIAYHYPESPFYSDALFYSAVCYYQKKECDLANKQFNKYLALGGKLKHFEKVFEYKLAIANQFAEGKKKHLFGVEKLPKWASAKSDAVEVYDEIIAALPAHELAAIALYQKADLERNKKEYKESIESLQTLARRFPKHTLAAESYLRISEIYLEESRRESQNPDLLALAHVNIQKFGRTFPSDERVEQAHRTLVAMQEVYANSLYETGRFYERKKKPHASLIYYQDAILRYPETLAAARCRDRLGKISIKKSA